MAKRALYVGLGSSAVVAAVCGSATLPVATGCYTHQCDPLTVNLTTGDAVDENTWESGPIDAPWLVYNGNETLVFSFPPPFDYGRTPLSTEVDVGISPDASVTPNMTQWTTASGQLDEISNELAGVKFLNDAGMLEMIPGGLTLTNGSCAPYLVRVVVRFVPVTSGPIDEAGPNDSGVPTDATGIVD